MKSILFVLSMYHRDVTTAVDVTRWMIELGTKCNDRALVVTTMRATSLPEVAQVIHNLQQVFLGGVEHYALKSEDERGPWFSNNFMFRSVAQYIAHKIKDTDAFYFFEPDCTPMIPEWWDKIKAEYQNCGTPFMGDVRGVTHAIDAERHMNGSGIYPQNVAKFSIKALRADAQPWDAYARDEIVPRAAATRLITTLFNTIDYREADGQIITRLGHNGVRNAGPDVGIDARAVVVHGCKDGSLLAILRRRKSEVKEKHLTPKVLGGRGNLASLTTEQSQATIRQKLGKRKLAMAKTDLTSEEERQVKGLVATLEIFCGNAGRHARVKSIVSQSKLAA